MWGLLMCGGIRSASAAVLDVPSPVHPTIQSAIDAAVDGDEIVVAPGVYPEAIDFLGKAVTLRSAKGAEVTTIDGSGFGSSVVKCISGEGPDTILEGFTITGGTGTWSFSFLRGGGLYVLRSHPTVRRCIFISNSAERGGGIHVADASIDVSDCTFIANHASFTDGAGIFFELSDGAVRNCRFEANTASRGAAVSSSLSSPTFTDCFFTKNEATFGAAVSSQNGAHPVFRHCVFTENEGGDGGAVFVEGSEITIAACVFSKNHGSGLFAGYGGAITNRKGTITVRDSLFEYNSAVSMGGALNISGGVVRVSRCTFRGNSAAQGAAMMFGHLSVFGPAVLEMSDSILWDEGDEILVKDDSTLTITYSNVQGGFPGEGNIDAPPRFRSRDDARLLPNSPCINRGNPAFTPDVKDFDLGGNPRLLGCRVDMGAYESAIQQAPGDYDGNRWNNLADFAAVQRCYGQSAGPEARACLCALDADDNGVLDAFDYEMFARDFGAGKRPPPRIDHFTPPPGKWVTDPAGLREVTIGFTEPVIIPDGALYVWGLANGEVTDFTTSYDSATDAVTLMFDPPLRGDRVTIEVDYTVSGLTGTELDGEIYNPYEPELPSGDGVNGGLGLFRLTVFVGDVNGDGVVNVEDQLVVNDSLHLCAGDPGFDPRADVNGDGCVDAADAQIVVDALGDALPQTDGTPPEIDRIWHDSDTVFVRFKESILGERVSPRGCFVIDRNGQIVRPEIIGGGGFSARYDYDNPDFTELTPCTIHITNSITDLSGEFPLLPEAVPCD